jgi:hypothetical protein
MTRWQKAGLIFFIVSLSLVTLVLVVHFSVTPRVICKRQEVLRNLFKDTAQVFNQHQVDYWADYGTLLGIEREGDVILNDRDVDIGIWKKDQERAWRALQSLKQKGYQVENTGKKLNVWRISGWSSLRAEIMLYQDVGQNKVKEAELEFNKEWIVPLQKRSWQGQTISVPYQVDTVLTFMYGDWRTPRDGDKGRDGEARGETYNRSMAHVKRWTTAVADLPLLFQK